MKVNMALCFLDENDKIVVKEDMNVSWDLNKNEESGRLEHVIIMDQVAAMLNSQAQNNLYSHIRNLLDKAKGIDNE